MFDVIEMGRTFAPYIARLKLKAIMESPIERKNAIHLAQRYETSLRKYNTSFERQFKATDHDLIIKIDKQTSNDLIMVKSGDDDGSSLLMVDKNSIASGKKTSVRVPKGTSVILKFPEFPQVLQYSGRLNCVGEHALDASE